MFQISCDSLQRLRSYCGETARRSIRPNYSVHPVGKTIRWIEKKWMTRFFDGLDELYHHAKFGEDRTTHTGCRCEKCDVCHMFVCLSTGRMTRSGKLPVLNLLTGQKSGFSPLMGDSLNQFTSNLTEPTGTWVRLVVQHFSWIASGVGKRPQKYQKIRHFDTFQGQKVNVQGLGAVLGQIVKSAI